MLLDESHTHASATRPSTFRFVEAYIGQNDSKSWSPMHRYEFHHLIWSLFF